MHILVATCQLLIVIQLKTSSLAENSNAEHALKTSADYIYTLFALNVRKMY